MTFMVNLMPILASIAMFIGALQIIIKTKQWREIPPAAHYLMAATAPLWFLHETSKELKKLLLLIPVALAFYLSQKGWSCLQKNLQIKKVCWLSLPFLVAVTLLWAHFLLVTLSTSLIS